MHALQEAQQEDERQRQADRLLITDAVRGQVLTLTSDFPRVWQDPHTTDHDRKRLVRLLIEDVTLLKTHELAVQVRFKGGATQTLALRVPRPIWQTWETTPEVVQTIDALLNEYTDEQVALILNTRGLHTGKGGAFNGRLVGNVRRSYSLKGRYERLREVGMLSAEEVAQILAVKKGTVKAWRKAGLLRGHAYDDKNNYLYEPPGPNPPTKCQGRKLAKRRLFTEIPSECAKEVQYEA